MVKICNSLLLFQVHVGTCKPYSVDDMDKFKEIDTRSTRTLCSKYDCTGRTTHPVEVLLELAARASIDVCLGFTFPTIETAPSVLPTKQSEEEWMLMKPSIRNSLCNITCHTYLML